MPSGADFVEMMPAGYILGNVQLGVRWGVINMIFEGTIKFGPANNVVR